MIKMETDKIEETNFSNTQVSFYYQSLFDSSRGFFY